LQLVKDHQRQHHRAHRRRRQKRARHRHTRGQALLRAAKNGRDLVCFREPERPTEQRRGGQDDGQERREQQREHHERDGRHFAPEPLRHRFAERAVDDEEDRAAIDPAEDLAVPCEQPEQATAAQVADDERHQQLEDEDQRAVPVDRQFGCR
jgi:hypothetical protein